MALGDAETVDFWTSFLRSLRERGLKVPSPEDPTGVVLVTSDAHAGIRAAVRAILPGAAWQRCRVHFARNITSRLGSARSKPVNALVSTIFAQTSQEAVAAQYKHVVDSLREAFPEIAQMLIDAEPDPTAFATTRPPRGALDQDPAAATPSSGSTGRSSAAPMWSRSSPTASPHAP